MEIFLPLDTMSVEEKLQTMETIWEDLCKHASALPSPVWHEELLNDREAQLQQGNDEVIDWEKARKDIHSKIACE